MPNLFISYRRHDSADATGRLYDRLKAHFGSESVFYDVDTIPIGVDFRKHLSEQVGKCDVFLAIIGDNWLNNCYEDGSRKGQRRLDDPQDWVRIEIEAALTRDIPVVPVLVGRARMPAPLDLPDSIRDMVFRQNIEVRSDGNYDSYTNRLIRAIERIFGNSNARDDGGIRTHSERKRRDPEETKREELESKQLRSDKRKKEDAELEQRHREDEAHREKKRLQCLQRDRETKLAAFVIDAMDRTQGVPNQVDVTGVNELIREHCISVKRATEIINEAKKRWVKRREYGFQMKVAGFGLIMSAVMTPCLLIALRFYLLLLIIGVPLYFVVVSGINICKMRRLRLVRPGVILAFCLLTTTPFAILALLLLGRPGAREAFEEGEVADAG